MTEKNTSKKADAVVKATADAPTRKEPVHHYVTGEFYDNIGMHFYRVGEVYQETSAERTKALLEAKVSKLNRIGRSFLSTEKPEGK